MYMPVKSSSDSKPETNVRDSILGEASTGECVVCAHADTKAPSTNSVATVAVLILREANPGH
jgi:hypothetical protein